MVITEMAKAGPNLEKSSRLCPIIIHPTAVPNQPIKKHKFPEICKNRQASLISFDLNIYNNSGQLMSRQPDFNNCSTLDLSIYPAGIYALEIKNNQFFAKKKIIVQH